jgi:sugar phosphate isomerase/epimerase
LGFGLVDLWASPPIAGHVDLQRDTARELRSRLERHALAAAALTLYFTTPEQKVRGMEIAAELGARCIIFEPGPSADFHERMTNLKVRGLTIGEPGEGLEKFAERLWPIVRRAEELDIRVALEVPHVYTVGETLPQVEHLLGLVNSPHLTWTLALPHVLARGATILDAIRQLGSRTDVFYLWDVKAGYRHEVDDRAFGSGDEQTPGNGSLRFQEVFAALSACGFRGLYDVKCHGTEPWDDAERVTAVVERGLRRLERQLGLVEDDRPVKEGVL